MVVLSKQLSTPTLNDFSCYDVIHPWHPHCRYVGFDLGMSCLKNSFRLYASLYLLSSLLQGKLLNPEKWPKIAADIFRSTCFLTWNGAAFISGICLFRWILQTFYPSSIAFLPAFVASFTALQFEREKRKQALTVYMLNTASQTFYSLAKNNGFIRSVPNGEVLIFSCTAAAFVYLYKKRIQSKDLTSFILRFLIGTNEIKKFKTESVDNQKRTTVFQLIYDYYNRIIESIPFGPKHKCCLHERGCLYYSITGFLRPFFIGYLGRVLIKTLSSLKLAIEYPQLIGLYLLSKQNIKFGLFLGFFTLLCRSTNCLLRWLRDKDEPMNGLIAGFVAGWAMLFYRAPELSSYSFWKLIEVLCTIGVQNGQIPVIPYATDVIYALSTASVFHLSLFQPHVLPISYWKFLVNLSDSKYKFLNRECLTEWGGIMSDRCQYGIKPNPKYSSEALKTFLQQSTLIQ